MELKYMFWLYTNNGERIEWKGLTMAEAKQMYKMTTGYCRGGVAEYGWEVQ